MTKWLLHLLLAACATLLAAVAEGRDIAPDEWISLQNGTFTGRSGSTGYIDVSQSQFGMRLVYMSPEQLWDVQYNLGVLKAPAGYLFDAEFDATGTIHAGEAEWHPLLVVGIPIGLMGEPYNFGGYDVTLGAGMVADLPVGRGFLEARGQAAFNFLSWLANAAGDPYDANSAIHAKEAMLLYRLSAAAWFPVGRHQVRVELRRDDFNKFHTNALGIGMALGN